MRNRLALNDLMREFCAQEGIAFLDLTAELQSTLGTGRNVYFPDDSHWNAAGHEVAAQALSRLLRAQGTLTSGSSSVARAALGEESAQSVTNAVDAAGTVAIQRD
jgi:hypothetical protein